jgi:hypothetical protein
MVLICDYYYQLLKLVHFVRLSERYMMRNVERVGGQDWNSLSIENPCIHYSPRADNFELDCDLYFIFNLKQTPITFLILKGERNILSLLIL